MRSKFGVEEGEGIFKRCRAPSEAVFRKATITTAAAILYASLVASVVEERVFPERQVGVHDIIRYCTHNRVVTVIEGPEPVVNK